MTGMSEWVDELDMWLANPDMESREQAVEQFVFSVVVQFMAAEQRRSFQKAMQSAIAEAIQDAVADIDISADDLADAFVDRRSRRALASTA